MNQKTEQQAKEEILNLVKEYCDTYHNVTKPFEEGQRIPYASRVYDSAVIYSGRIGILPEACEHSNPSWFGFMVTCREGVDRNKVVPYMESHGIQTRMLFAGNLTKHPCFDEMRATGEGYRIVGKLANTDRIMEDTFWIGVYPGMTDEMIDYMAKTLIGAIA